MGTSLLATSRRSAWAVADQAVSSVSNLLVLILVARSVAPTEFGAFAVAVETYLVLVFVSRGISSDVLVTAHAADAPAALKHAVGAGAAVMIWAGLALAFVVAAIGWALDGPLGDNLLVLALVLPGLLIQDFVRYVFVVRDRPEVAFVLDAAWLVLEIPVLLVAIRADQGSAVLLALWGACGVVAGLIGVAWARLVPAKPSVAVAWLRQHSRLWPYFVLENLVFRATILIVMAGLTISTGLAGVAGLRAATAIFAPVGVLGRGVAIVAVPDLARRAANPAAVRRGVRRLAWLLTPLPLMLAAALLLAPEQVGEELFGQSWHLAAPLLWLTALSAAGSMYSTAVTVGLRALQAARSGLHARMVVALLSVLAALVGGWAGGAYGAALAMAITSPFHAAVWWWQFHRAGSTRSARAEEGQVGPDRQEGESWGLDER